MRATCECSLPRSAIGVGLTHNSTVSNHTASPFLQLPGELRNDIYHRVLGAATFEFDPCRQGPGRRLRRTRQSLSCKLVRRDLHLPFVCKQINHEIKYIVRNFRILRLEGCGSSKLLRLALSPFQDVSSGVQTLTITLTMIDRIVFWVTQLEKQMEGTDASSEVADAHAAFMSLESVVLECQPVYDDEVRAMRVFFGKPELQVVRGGSVISD